MIILDVWAVAVLAACVVIARGHPGERIWTVAFVGAAVAVASLLGESLIVGRQASMTSALLLIAPALLGVFVLLPYLTVVTLFVTVGPHLTARLRNANPWPWSLLGWVVWTVFLTPTIASQVMR